MNQYLAAPFPFYGGKQGYASEVWDQFGPVTRYVEPFAGSLAIFLRCPWPDAMTGASVVCDKNPLIANFWRAIKGNGPDGKSAREVAFWADDCTIHQNLRARHKWLLEWARDNAQRLWDDADFFSCKAAGWWAWGMSNWVGGGFCTGEYDRQAPDRVPHLCSHPGGSGVQIQKLALNGCEPPDTRPHVMSHPGGQGVQMLNLSLPDKRHYVCDTGYGQGVQIQTDRGNELDAAPLDGSRLQPWMLELCRRLKRTVVLHRDWKSAVSPKMLMRETGSKWVVGVFLDPPYKLAEGNRSKTLYQSDHDGTSDDVAKEAYDWAVENGSVERFRIAFCSRHGDFALPPGWTSSVRKFPGVKDAKRRETHQDEVMFSPHCGQGRRLL